MLKEILILLLFVLCAGKSREFGDSLSDVQEGSHNNVLEEGTFLAQTKRTLLLRGVAREARRGVSAVVRAVKNVRTPAALPRRQGVVRMTQRTLPSIRVTTVIQLWRQVGG